MRYIMISLSFMIFFSSCKKYLDAKPDKRLAIPSSVEDLRLLLDNATKMNTNAPVLGETSADNYYLPAAAYQSMHLIGRNAYIWDTAIYTPGAFPNEWSQTYNPIYSANTVIELLPGIERTVQNATSWDNTMGSALLFRAKFYLHAAWIWCRAYDPASADTDLGLPLRLNTNFKEPSFRSSVSQTYEQILLDLKKAVSLLPISPEHVMRPSRPAAYAYLARTYLSMRNYDSAFKYADLSLQLKNDLLDYNTLNTTPAFPFQRFNNEVIMHSACFFIYQSAAPLFARVDSTLYTSYDANDLRRTLYFKSETDGTKSYRGSYDNSIFFFNGPATDEMFLTRAECRARKGDLPGALNDLNTLMQKRWKAGLFTPFTAIGQQHALELILTERRKELIFRDLRWMDIKRLNKEGYNIIPARLVENQLITLQPNSNAYARPLPPDIIDITGMAQNP